MKDTMSLMRVLQIEYMFTLQKFQVMLLKEQFKRENYLLTDGK